ncbi:MAG: hypothetical protein H6R04_381 [Burkholderiaceae bacterium]|nr:hypothetical protein [Burkholderiaceae bacterium]
MNQKIVDWAVYAASLAFCMVFTWYAGRDYNWDLFNYYLYAPHVYLNGQLGTEFMGASFQSYLNPLPYVPFYLMVKAGWHSLIIGLLLAAFHALNLFLLWPICKRMMNAAEGAPRSRYFLALLCLLLSVANTLFLVEVGSTYVDVSTSVFVLAGVLLLIMGTDEPARLMRYALAGGVLLGIGAGLKLTNAPFAVAACVFGFLPGMQWMRRFRFFVSLIVGGIAGGLLATGHWCWLLYREFGNPIFPFFNGVFRSPDFISVSHRHERFLPESLGDALTLPFRIIETYSWIYTELSAPEMRFAIFFGVGALLVLLVSLKKWWPALRERLDAVGFTASQMAFVAYIAVGWLIWMVMFSNGRYLMPLTLLIGVGCGAVLNRLLPQRLAMLTLVLLIGLQLVQFHYTGRTRFSVARPWNGAWFELEIPAKLKNEPHLSLSMGVQPDAFLVAFYHPDSRFVNIVGQYSLDLDASGGQRLRRLLEEYRGRTRVVFENEMVSGEISEKYQAMRNMQLNRFGLRLDETDCISFVHTGVPMDLPPGNVSGRPLTDAERSVKIVSCGVKPVSVDQAIERDRIHAAMTMDKVQQACPSRFTATSPVVFRDRHAWARFDLNTEIWLRVDREYIYAQFSGKPGYVIASRDAFERGEAGIDCLSLYKSWQGSSQ